jgi:N-acetylmuramoyl-L-alanine amidase
VPLRHVVEVGEGLSRIAEQYGLSPVTIWDDPGNASLREVRADPNVLLPGDALVIPDKRPGVAVCATGKRHRFRRVGVPALYELRLLDDQDAPRAGLPYKLTVGDVVKEGTTDDAGMVRQWLPCATRAARLTVGSGQDAEEYELEFTLRPVLDLQGAQQRLRNLGFGDSEEGITAFQEWAGLTRNGTLDDDTKAALLRLHDQAG